MGEWTGEHPRVALIGSHARNAAGQDSDIDLLLLCAEPDRFRDQAWVAGINWSPAGLHLTRWCDEEYGAVWSRRVWFDFQCEIEFAFASLAWADTSPVDRGTTRVVAGGCRILYDPDDLVNRLKLALRCAQPPAETSP